jgi:uncharacterized protein (DUF1800 family)
MQETQAVQPSFSGPQAPVRSRVRRLPGAARATRARIPKRLIAEQREAAAKVRRRMLKRVLSSSDSLSVEQRLVQRATMGQTAVEMERIAGLGYDGYLEYQLDYEAIDNSELEDLLATNFITLAMDAPELIRRYENNQGVPVFQLISASIYRALYSPRQLYERMVVFWTDHFNIHLFGDLQPLLKPVDDREVIRKHALGKFPEMLAASAHSPAMLIYLTNTSNVKDRPNENYARELMELHTLGVDNGYKQKDVREVARCFTGWTINGLFGSNGGTFAFSPSQHDTGAKNVMGRAINSGGIGDGERVLEILANSRRTAKFLARKRLIYFQGYEPRKKDVNKVANAYMKTGGDIKAMLRQVLKKSRMQKAKPKLKRPTHLTVSAMRGLFAQLNNPSHLFETLFQAGHLPFNWEPPNGYPDSEEFWSGFILPRWNWATTFLNQEADSGVAVDLPFVDPSLSAKQIVSEIDRYLLNGAMTPATGAALTDFLTAKKIDKNRIRDTIGLAVASPEFQEY